MAALPEQFANRIIAAHGLWKFRLHEAIESGRSRFDPTVVERDDRCPFGQWIHGEGRSTHGDDPRFQRIREHHATFHRNAATVLRLALAGRAREATDLMAPGQPFLTTSIELVHLIDSWRRNESAEREVDPLRCTTLETLAQADAAVVAAALVQENVVAVAASVEEMSAAIGEVAASASGAAAIANESVAEMNGAMETVARLTHAVSDISTVVTLINTIAAQTRLLALNATIEAARAGEFGKGFAVVAHEVKELARATSSATADVEARIGAIRETAIVAASSIEQFGARAQTIAGHQTTIASAVEEQRAATEVISRRIHDASAAGGEVAEIVGAVGLSARNATRALADRSDR